MGYSPYPLEIRYCFCLRSDYYYYYYFLQKCIFLRGRRPLKKPLLTTLVNKYQEQKHKAAHLHIRSAANQNGFLTADSGRQMFWKEFMYLLGFIVKAEGTVGTEGLHFHAKRTFHAFLTWLLALYLAVK